jgi:hypothetical protein
MAGLRFSQGLRITAGERLTRRLGGAPGQDETEFLSNPAETVEPLAANGPLKGSLTMRPAATLPRIRLSWPLPRRVLQVGEPLGFPALCEKDGDRIGYAHDKFGTVVIDALALADVAALESPELPDRLV